MVLLTQDQLRQKVDVLKVGQVWKCIEDNRLVMISLVKPKEVQGYMFDGFQVVPYFTFALLDFVRYFELKLDPHIKVNYVTHR